MWKDYWHTIKEMPESGHHVLLRTESNRHVKAHYDKDLECFVSEGKDSRPVQEPVAWIYYPLKERNVVNMDVPVEVVYENLYNEYHKAQKDFKYALKYIRQIHDYIRTGGDLSALRAYLAENPKTNAQTITDVREILNEK